MTDTFETLTNQWKGFADELHAKRITRYALSVQSDDLTRNIAQAERATLSDVAAEWAADGVKSNEDQRRAETTKRLTEEPTPLADAHLQMLGNLRGSQRQLAELDATIEGLMLDLSLLRRRMDHAIATHGTLESALLYSTEPR